MTPDPDFDEAIRDAGRRIGDIFRKQDERQRREVHDKIRSLLEMARGRVGGELAEALLHVMLVTDKWVADAASPPAGHLMLDRAEAADEILTAMETGLGVRTPAVVPVPGDGEAAREEEQ